MVNNILNQFGLSDNEISIYLETLKLGRATPARIAKAVSINRTTVYTVSRVLIKKGLLSEDLTGKTLCLVPLPPKDLVLLINREKRKLEEKEKLLEEAIKDLSLLPSNTQFALPALKFVQENDVEDFLYENSKKWIDSSAKYNKTWWGFRDHTFAEQYHKWIESVWQEEAKKPNGLKLKLLANPLKLSEIDKKLNKKKYKGREVKPWKKDTSFNTSTFTAGDYIVMTVTKERPFYLIEIYNPILARDLTTMFKELWSQSKT